MRNFSIMTVLVIGMMLLVACQKQPQQVTVKSPSTIIQEETENPDAGIEADTEVEESEEPKEVEPQAEVTAPVRPEAKAVEDDPDKNLSNLEKLLHGNPTAQHTFYLTRLLKEPTLEQIKKNPAYKELIKMGAHAKNVLTEIATSALKENWEYSQQTQEYCEECPPIMFSVNIDQNNMRWSIVALAEIVNKNSVESCANLLKQLLGFGGSSYMQVWTPLAALEGLKILKKRFPEKNISWQTDDVNDLFAYYHKKGIKGPTVMNTAIDTASYESYINPEIYGWETVFYAAERMTGPEAMQEDYFYYGPHPGPLEATEVMQRNFEDVSQKLIQLIGGISWGEISDTAEYFLYEHHRGHNFSVREIDKIHKELKNAHILDELGIIQEENLEKLHKGKLFTSGILTEDEKELYLKDFREAFYKLLKDKTQEKGEKFTLPPVERVKMMRILKRVRQAKAKIRAMIPVVQPYAEILNDDENPNEKQIVKAARALCNLSVWAVSAINDSGVESFGWRGDVTYGFQIIKQIKAEILWRRLTIKLPDFYKRYKPEFEAFKKTHPDDEEY